MKDIFNKLRTYFRDKDKESVVLVLKDGTIEPLGNDADEDVQLSKVEVHDKDKIIAMMDRYRDGNLVAIAHNHPIFHSWASGADMHNFNRPVVMIIYSNIYDTFNVYTPEMLIDMLKEEENILLTLKENI